MQRAKLAEGVAAELACRARPGDTILVIGGYPMDLPFVARTQTPLVVVQDWPQLRISDGDTWRRELLDAGGFEPELADRILRPPAVLQQAAREPGHWLLAPSHAASDQAIPPPGWRQVFEGPACVCTSRQRRKAPWRPGMKVCLAASGTRRTDTVSPSNVSLRWFVLPCYSTVRSFPPCSTLEGKTV